MSVVTTYTNEDNAPAASSALRTVSRVSLAVDSLGTSAGVRSIADDMLTSSERADRGFAQPLNAAPAAQMCPAILGFPDFIVGPPCRWQQGRPYPPHGTTSHGKASSAVAPR